MPRVERVDFVSVPTRDIARARRFYGEILGLPSNRDTPDEFETPNVTLALWQPEAEAVPFVPNTAGIALRVDSVEAARNELQARGVQFLGQTVDTGVCLMGFFYDPDGNVLILHRRYAPTTENRAARRNRRGTPPGTVAPHRVSSYVAATTSTSPTKPNL